MLKGRNLIENDHIFSPNASAPWSVDEDGVNGRLVNTLDNPKVQDAIVPIRIVVVVVWVV